MGKNISVYMSDSTLANLDLIEEIFKKQDEDDGYPPFRRSRSDLIAVAVSLAFDIYVSGRYELKHK